MKSAEKTVKEGMKGCVSRFWDRKGGLKKGEGVQGGICEELLVLCVVLCEVCGSEVKSGFVVLKGMRIG